MLNFLKWYLEKFGARNFIGLWLAWIGFVTLCWIEGMRAYADPKAYEPSTVFTTILGGVVGYVVATRAADHEPKKDEPPK